MLSDELKFVVNTVCNLSLVSNLKLYSGLGFVTLFVFIFLVGVYVSSWIGASVDEWFIKCIPLVKHIYTASKQISAAISPVVLVFKVSSPHVSPHDGAHTEANMELGFSVDLKAGNSCEKAELVVKTNIDMPIVGSPSLEKQIDASMPESLRCQSVNGCTSLKRRSQQDLEEARAEKRVKVESDVDLSRNSLNDSGVDPTTPLIAVEGCQDTSLVDELTTEKDDLRPFVQGDENSTAVRNGNDLTDLTDLLKGFDDSGDSEGDDDGEFGGDPSSWRSLEASLRDELIGNSNVNEIEVQVHTPLVEPIVNTVDIPSELEERDDIGTEVQAHAHERMGKQKPSPEVIMLDSDSDDDLMIVNSIDEAPQSKNTVKLEPGGLIQVPNENSQLENAVMQEPGGLRQVPNESSQLENAVMQEPGGLRQVPNQNPPVDISVKVEHGSARHVSNGNPQVENSVIVEHESTRQASNWNPQVENSVKVEHGSTRQVPQGMQRQVPQSMQSPGFQAVPMQSIRTADQELVLQSRPMNGKLEFYFVGDPMNSQNVVRMPMLPFGGNLNHPGLVRMYGGPYVNSSGRSTSFAPSNGYAQGATSSGEQAGRSHGLNPPTTSAVVPSFVEQAGRSNGWNPLTTSAAVPSSRDQAGPSHSWNPPTTSAAVPSFGEQAGPSHAGNPPSTYALVPFHSGASKAEPGLCGNINLGPQNVPAHNQLAVAKPCYDSTVGTVSADRLNVAHAMKQYDYYINKARNDRAIARTVSTPNEFVKEGNKRGLECRPDIVAYNEMKKECGNVNPTIVVGDLPGVQVGDRFTYRHQMAVVGLHRLPNVGIDYGHPPPDMIPTATAIVLMPKAGYVDDKDYGNTILYTGQGGRKKRNQAAPFVCDQELKKGNLALVKNYERKLPVRVIRGHSVLGNSGPGVLGYTYDGLYSIINYEFSLGLTGFNVYKFSLERLEGQPPIPPCVDGCTAHEWNKVREALGAVPLQVMDPLVVEDVKQLCI